MSLNRITLAAAALSMLCWISTPAFAQHNHGHGHGHKGKVTKTHTKGHHHGGSGHGGDLEGTEETGGNPHSNKGGELRGLNRANDVAGPHGELGRENALSHHGDHGDHGGSHHGD